MTGWMYFLTREAYYSVFLKEYKIHFKKQHNNDLNVFNLLMEF
jgi:hypothetical protein